MTRSLFESQLDQTAESFFYKIRNRFPKVSMGDENGAATNDPREARFFNFDYVSEGKTLGNITASFVDRQSLKIYYGQEITDNMDEAERNEWYQFLRELRRFAKSQLMTFDVRDITKSSLNHKDLSFAAQKQKGKKVQEAVEVEDLLESRVQWARNGNRSKGKLGNVRIDVIHSEAGNENPNNRLLRVQKIYLSNPNGERFMLPFNSVLGAKAMATHVDRGGNPYDSTGQMICEAVKEAKNLGRFNRITRKHAMEGQQAEVAEACGMVKQRIKEGLSKMTRPKVFESGLNILESVLSEGEGDGSVKNLFDGQYNDELAECFESAGRAYKKAQESGMRKLQEYTKLAEKIANPQFILKLQNDPMADDMIASGNYASQEAMVAKVLRDIADRITGDDCDDVRSFATTMSDVFGNGGNCDEEPKALAYRLAARHIGDLNKMKADPAYSKNVRHAEVLNDSAPGMAGIILGNGLQINHADGDAIVDLTLGEKFRFTDVTGTPWAVVRLQDGFKFRSATNSFDLPADKVNQAIHGVVTEGEVCEACNSKPCKC